MSYAKGPGRTDHFQTPPHAIDPIVSYLKREWRLWEPACGAGSMVTTLQSHGFCVIGTDIMTGHDFTQFDLFAPAQPEFDCIVTNPPYSIKDHVLERCYAIRKPFALLLPITALEGQRRQALYRKHGVEVVFMDKRINYRPPSGKGGGAWFSSIWVTHGLGIGAQMTFWQQEKRRQS